MSLVLPPGRHDNRLRVASTRLVGADRHAEYEITVDGKPTCWHRYREFDELCTLLKKEGVSSARTFPSKRIFGGNNPQVVLERKEGLEFWLQDVVASVQDKRSRAATLITEFLEADIWREQISSKISANQTSSYTSTPDPKEAKLREIVSRFVSSANLPSMYSSLSKVVVSPTRETLPASAVENFDATAFRSRLETSASIFVMLKPTKLA